MYTENGLLKSNSAKQKVTPSVKIVFAMGLITLSILGLIYTHFTSHLKEEIQHLTKRNQHQLMLLTDATKDAKKTVQGLRTFVENEMAHSEFLHSGYYKFLGEIKEKNGYGLSKLNFSDILAYNLNLTGLGSFSGDDSLKRELEVALSLKPIFVWVKDVYPETPWVYYLSKRRFITVFPYVDFDEFFMDEGLYEMDIFNDGIPENNPEHRPYITDVYEDEAGKGLMVTVGAPVYHEKDYLGIVAFDLTLQSISGSMYKNYYPGDTSYLINENAEIIALTSDNYSSSYISHKKSLLELRPGLYEFVQRHLLETDPVDFENSRIVISKVNGVPWILITERSLKNIYATATNAIIPLIAFLMVVMTGFAMYVREEHHQGRLKSEKSFKRFRKLLDYSNDSIFVIQPLNNKIVDANRTMCEFMNMSKEALMNKQASVLLTSIFKNEQWEEVLGNIKNKGRVVKEIDGIGSEGKDLVIELNAYYVADRDKVYIVVMLRDITQRKLAEVELLRHRDNLKELVEEKVSELTKANNAAEEASQMLQNVLDTIPVRVFWKSKDLVYLGCNKLFAKDSGYDESEQLIGLTDYDMGWKEQAELYRADDRKVMNEGIAKLSYEENQTTPEGNVIWLQTSKIPLRDLDGNIFGILGTYDDITVNIRPTHLYNHA